MQEADFPVVAVSDLSGTYYRAEGLNIHAVMRHCFANDGFLSGYREAELLPADALLGMDVDLLIPAAIGDVIREDNVDTIKAKLIVEAANSPISPEADRILDQRGVVILPDILANAGGVTVSYFEWVQNRQYYEWSLDRVRQELDRVMTDSFERVWTAATERKISLRTAAYALAIQRVYNATRLQPESPRNSRAATR